MIVLRTLRTSLPSDSADPHNHKTRAPNATISSYTAGSVAIVRTTSTSFITGTGLKKCNPTNRCGLFVAVAISVIVNDDVLLAKIVVVGQIASNAEKSSRFAGNCSMIASTITSQSFKSSIFVVPFNRPRRSEEHTSELQS